MANTEGRPLLETVASEDLKKSCANDYKRFYGLRTDIIYKYPVSMIIRLKPNNQRF